MLPRPQPSRYSSKKSRSRNVVGHPSSFTSGFQAGLPGAAGLQLRSPRRLMTALVASSITFFLLWHLDDAFTVHFRDLGYIFRPLWDKPPPAFDKVIVLPDQLNTGPPSRHATCSDYGLTNHHNSGNDVQVYDVVIFSVEVDLLELRLRELYNVVDYFVINEATLTFTGEHKPLLLKDFLESSKGSERFGFAKEKLVYNAITDLDSVETSARIKPFENEAKMRRAVSAAVHSLSPPENSLIIQSDIDEIPTSRSITLLKECSGWGEIVHLGMTSYLYSFEYPLNDNYDPKSIHQNLGKGYGPRQWRATVKRYLKGKTTYTHSRMSDTIIENAGWHCSFCFRYIKDFVFKMTSFSHNDRITSENQLLPSTIQDKICKGQDVFDMYPEAYNYRDFFKQLGRIVSSSRTDILPRYLLEEEKEDLKWLLPGGCRREDRPAT